MGFRAINGAISSDEHDFDYFWNNTRLCTGLACGFAAGALLGLGYVAGLFSGPWRADREPCAGFRVPRARGGKRGGAVVAVLLTLAGLLFAVLLLGACALGAAFAETLAVGSERATDVYKVTESALADILAAFQSSYNDLDDKLKQVQSAYDAFTASQFGNFVSPVLSPVKRELDTLATRLNSTTDFHSAAVDAAAAMFHRFEVVQHAPATCSAPYCLDMRNYPMFRNGACMCAAQSLAHVRELALVARDLSVLAAVGAGLQIVGLAALLVRLSIWLGLLSHRRRLSTDSDAPDVLPIQVLPAKPSLGALPAPGQGGSAIELRADAGGQRLPTHPCSNPSGMLMLEASPAAFGQAPPGSCEPSESREP
ncbi:hypothetical protein WJX81_001318 [Elliptochloris bilobata]|uniref:Protein tweety homolog n=1 Tax=Elliptochloris bilobata TaxID=381761 RepID=A0AAW1QLN4_9CHLO